MDAEEAQQLLAQVQLRCLVLEADKEVEGQRAVKYRNILDTLAREDSSSVEASRVIRTARSALASPALPAPSVCCPNLYAEACLCLPGSPPVIIESRGANFSRSLHSGQKAQFIIY